MTDSIISSLFQSDNEFLIIPELVLELLKDFGILLLVGTLGIV
jgi:hypothetical protein